MKKCIFIDYLWLFEKSCVSYSNWLIMERCVHSPNKTTLHQCSHAIYFIKFKITTMKIPLGPIVICKHFFTNFNFSWIIIKKMILKILSFTKKFELYLKKIFNRHLKTWIELLSLEYEELLILIIFIDYENLKRNSN